MNEKNQKIVGILKDEYHYTDNLAEMAANDLCSLQEPLDAILGQWLQDRTFTDYEAEGFSLRRMIEQGHTFMSAIVALDWLLVEPELAREELSRKVVW
jgi:hypothetical protein